MRLIAMLLAMTMVIGITPAPLLAGYGDILTYDVNYDIENSDSENETDNEITEKDYDESEDESDRDLDESEDERDEDKSDDENGEDLDDDESCDEDNEDLDDAEIGGGEQILSAAEEMITVFVTFEGYNLGHGFYIEPTPLTIPVGSNVEDATRALLNERGIAFDYHGEGGLFYLSGVHGFNRGWIDPPFVPEGYLPLSAIMSYDVNEGGLLAEFMYSSESGWMTTINHVEIDRSAGAWELDNDDVIRWQFTVSGLGADLGVPSAWSATEPLYSHADKTELIRGLFAHNANPDAKQAALDVIINPLATPEQVTNALLALQGEYIPETKPNEPVPPIGNHPLIIVISPANAQDMNDQIRAALVRDFGQISGQYDYSVVRRLAVAGNVTVNLFNQAITRNTIRPYLEELDLSAMTGSGSVMSLGGGVAPTAINYAALRHVVMPSRATTTLSMFAGHTSLEFVTFAGNILGGWNGNNFFQGATNLRSIAFLGDTAPTISITPSGVNAGIPSIFVGLPAGFSTEYITALVPDAEQGGYELAAFAQHFSDVVSIGGSWPGSTNRTGLTSALIEAQGIDISSLAPLSEPILLAAIATAQGIANNPLSLQSSVDSATAHLRYLLDTEFALIPVGEDVTFISAPRGTTVGVFHKADNRHFAPFVSHELTLDSERSNAQYDVWRVHIPLNQGRHIEAFGDGTAKLARRITVTQHRTTIHVNPTPLDEWVSGRGTAWHDANVLTNLDDTGAVNLSVGGAFDLDTFRVWQAMTGTTENYFVEPLYSFEVFGNSASVERIGAPGREQLRITALNPGVSVIKITYGPVEYILANGTTVHHFDALDPRNTLAVVVNVNGGADFDTGMTGLSAPGVTIGEGITVRNDFDTWHFDQTVGYREFTFAPAEGTTVRVHSPLNISSWGTGWTTYTADSDGNFTVRLRDGRNIIEMNNNGSIRHQVIRARGVEVTISNVTRPNEDFAVGDTAQISIRGITEPIEKLAGIYNPGFGTVHRLAIRYYTAEGFIESNRTNPQYQTLISTFTIQYTLTDESMGRLEGYIRVGSMGSNIGAHRNISLSGVAANMQAVGIGPYSFGALPIIVLPIEGSSQLPNLTASEAAELISTHNFEPIVQPWLGAAGTTRDAAIAAARAQVEDLVGGRGITIINLTPWPNNFVALPNPVVGGTAAINRTFRATFNDGGPDAFADFTISLEFLHAAATEVTVSLALTQPAGNVVANNTTTGFNAAAAPLGIPQDVAWSVEGHAEASIDEDGCLTVGAVPAGTQLTITATRIATSADATLHSGTLIVTVVDHLYGWAGRGTAQAPFLISSTAELMLLAYRVNVSPIPATNSGAGAGAFAGTHFRVTDDIQLGSDWQPIGKPYIATTWVNPNLHQGPSFEGIFDGGGHTISFAHGSQPLFGAVWHNAEIRNVNIYGPYIAGHGLIAGVAAQFAFGTTAYVLIDNVRILSGTTIRGSGFAGNDGFRPLQLDIRNSTVEEGVRIGFDAVANAPFDQNTVYFENTAGTGPGVGSFASGLAGRITNSVSYATVYGHPDVRNVGGLVGYKQHSMRTFLIDNSHFHGTVNAPQSLHVGGILGAGYDSPNPRNSAPHHQLVGDWAASNSPGENIRNSTVTGTVIGYDFVGGIVGGAFGNQVWSGGASGAHYFHAGSNRPEHNVVNNHFSGTLTATREGTRNIGAIFGYVRSLNRNNNISENTFTAESADRGIGHVSIIDTIHLSLTAIAGTTYFSTRGGSPDTVAGFSLGSSRGAGRSNYYRVDDPLGADADALTRAVTNQTEISRTALNAAIARAEERNEANYTPVSWESLQTAIDSAITVRDDADVTQQRINSAVGALNFALGSLVLRADLTALNAAITTAEARVRANYTTLSWNNMQAALEAARRVRDDVNAAQNAVNTAANNLTAAINALAPTGGGGGTVQPTPARVFISVQNPYARYDHPTQFLTGRYVDIEPGDTAYSILRRPEFGLTIQSSGHSVWAGMYVQSINGWGEFDGGPLSGWMYVVDNVFPDFSSSEFELQDGQVLHWLYTYDLGTDLTAWGTGNFGANRTALRAEITRAEGLNRADYTLASWSAMQTVLEAARTAVDEPLATQVYIDADANALREAIDGLVPATGGTAIITPDVSVVVNIASRISGSHAAVTVMLSDITDAFAQVLQELESEDADAIGEIRLNIETYDAISLSAAIPQNALSYVSGSANVALTIQSGIATMTFDSSALRSIAAQSGANENVVFDVRSLTADGLSEAQRDIVEGNPAFQFTITAGNNDISDFGDGSVTVILPYALIEGEDASLLSVFNLTYDNTLIEMAGARYNSDLEGFVFTTNRFSLFFIGISDIAVPLAALQESSPDVSWSEPFTDVNETDWFYDAVGFMVTNELMSGTGVEQFSPDMNLTRAMIVTILWRLEGSPIAANNSNFNDVANNRWYSSAVAWASTNGIVNGYGNGLFGSNDNVTREQIAVILQNYAQFRGENAFGGPLALDFADADSVSPWARESMEWANVNGLITGRTLTTLAPNGTATRAESAAILQRFIEAR